MSVALIEDPAPEDLGPAMLALTPQQRRFAIAYLGDSRDASRAAEAAGYSTESGGHRVAAHRMLRNPKVIEAIKEEAGRRLNGAAYVAVSGLTEIAADPEHKDRYKAAASILNRVGFPEVSAHAVKVEPEEYDRRYAGMPTSELLARIQHHAIKLFPDLVTRREDGAIDIDFVEVNKRTGGALPTAKRFYPEYDTVKDDE